MPHTENENAPGIIFDLDGTLADTLEDIADGVNAALAARELASCSLDQIRGWVGDGVSQLLSRASGVDDPDEVSQLVDRFRRRYDLVCLERTRLYAGLDDVLDFLSAAGCPMCVLSNKPHDFTRRICRALLTRWRFMSCLGVSEITPKKPDPAGALEMARTMHRQPDRVIIIGDGEADIETARAAGMSSIAVTWGFRSQDLLQRHGPDAMATTPAELIDALKGSLHSSHSETP